MGEPNTGNGASPRKYQIDILPVVKKYNGYQSLDEVYWLIKFY